MSVLTNVQPSQWFAAWWTNWLRSNAIKQMAERNSRLNSNAVRKNKTEPASSTFCTEAMTIRLSGRARTREQFSSEHTNAQHYSTNRAREFGCHFKFSYLQSVSIYITSKPRSSSSELQFSCKVQQNWMCVQHSCPRLVDLFHMQARSLAMKHSHEATQLVSGLESNGQEIC